MKVAGKGAFAAEEEASPAVALEGAGKGALAVEEEASALAVLRLRLAGWLRTEGKGCVRENGVPRASASSGLSSSPRTWYPAASSSVTSDVGSSWI